MANMNPRDSNNALTKMITWRSNLKYHKSTSKQINVVLELVYVKIKK